MSEISAKPPLWFWLIVIVALLWNLMGVTSYISTVGISPDALAALPDAERILMETMPAWATSAFAIAVFAGVSGCILLLLRKTLAISVFLISFIAIVLQMTYWLAMTNSLDVYGPGGAAMPVMVIIFGAFLIWFAKFATVKGWLT